MVICWFKFGKLIDMGWAVPFFHINWVLFFFFFGFFFFFFFWAGGLGRLDQVGLDLCLGRI